MANLDIQARSSGFQEAQAGFDGLTKAQQKVIVKGSAIGDTMKKSSKKAKRGIEGMAMSLLGVHSTMAIIDRAVRAATASFRAMNAEQERGAQLTEQAAGPMGKLAQLAGGDVKKLKGMIGEAKKSATETGMTLDQAMLMQFALESNDIADRRKPIASLTSVLGGGEAAIEAATGVAGIQKAMGAEETGGLRNVINKVFAASEVSPVDFAQFLLPAAGLGASMRMAKVGDEEMLSAMSQVTPAAGGSVEMAGTQLEAFGKTMGKKGLTGKGLVGAAKEIEAMGMSEKELIKFFGRKEGLKGYMNILQVADQIEELTTRLHEVDAATGKGDVMSGVLATFEAIPELAATKRKQRAERGEEIAQMEAAGASTLDRQAANLDLAAQVRGRPFLERSILKGAGYLGRGMESVLEDSGQADKTPGSMTRAVGRFAASHPEPFSDPVTMAMHVAKYVMEAGWDRLTNGDGVKIADESCDRIAAGVTSGQRTPADAGLSVE